MAFDLVLHTPKTAALQEAIQRELSNRHGTEGDVVMAEYILIMLINNKSAEQINAELVDLIGSDFDPSFTDWLFEEAQKPFPATETSESNAPAAQDSASSSQPASTSGELSIAGAANRARQNAATRPGAPLPSQAQGSNPSGGQKRTASMRSPSPSSSQPSKARRTNDLPDRPRAMRDERSLLERVGGPHPNANRPRNNNLSSQEVDRIQAQIDAVTKSAEAPPMPFMHPGMDPSAMNAGMNPGGMNPMMEMMAAQMALMTQMAANMGMVPPMPGFFPGPPGMMNPGFNGGMQGAPGARRGRGMGNPRGGGRGGMHRGGAPQHFAGTPDQGGPFPAPVQPVQPAAPAIAPQAPAAPTPIHATAKAIFPSKHLSTPPTRPLSPTLCKFGVKCTNSLCRYSHPSPSATVESGLVLSTDACPKGRECKDKDCTLSHVSPATTAGPPQGAAPPPQAGQTPCKFGNSCTRPGCAFVHPRDAPSTFAGKPCRFGSACTRADCPFSHPPDRVLPGSFTRGDIPQVPVSHNKSMSFKPDPKAPAFVPKNQGETQQDEQKVEESKTPAVVVS